ncbi:DUF3592 domain-containing protein [Ferruginibacter sp.]
MRISKWSIYFIGTVIILSLFTLPRFIWLSRSVKIKAVVIYTAETRSLRTTQTYPVFQFYANGERITWPGNYNLPYTRNDSVMLRYNPADELDVKIDSFEGKWLDKIMWLAPLLFVWTVFFIPKDFKPAIVYSEGKFRISFS